jgi:hypothetical protein
MPSLLTLALLLAISGGISLSAAAQTSPPASTSDSSPASLPNPDKKVWTNDDLESLRAKAPISIASAAAAKKPAPTGNPKPDDSAAKVLRYRKQLLPLYAELPKIDAQLDQMHSFEDGSYKAPGGLSRFPGMPLSPADQITQLEKRRQQVLDQISQIEDQARHDGVLPGDLR